VRRETLIPDVYRRLQRSVAFVLAVIAFGVVGYLIIGYPEYGLLDAIYMTAITLTTVGYGETIDLSNNPAGRVFTIVLLAIGVGSVLNFLSSLATLWADGEAQKLMRRRRMQKQLDELDEHIIVAGAGHTGIHVVTELIDTRRPFAVIEVDPERAAELPALLGREVPVVVGDATEDSVLLDAGVERARALVACVSSDKDNLIVTLSSRLLAPAMRIVARCIEEQIEHKIRKAGADAVVSPNRIGGLRLISEAVRPSAVSYLERMMREQEGGLRVESARIEAESTLAGASVRALTEAHIGGLHLLAILDSDDKWNDTPDADTPIREGDRLIFTGGPEVRTAVLKLSARPR
jgi:voltage-gated potassium channel